MSLEQASFVAQIVSALTIIASLIFVGVQVRQATRALRNSSSQAHSALYTQIISAVIENAEYASIWSRGLIDPSRLDDVEWVRFVAYTSGMFRFYEASRVQWLRGNLDDEHWQNIEQQIRTLGTQPGVQAWWQVRAHWHSAAFRSWFEGLQLGTDGSMYGRASVPQASKKGAGRVSGTAHTKE
ncbi:MAG: hypothetical protein ABI853_05105 [Sphingomicrobium sp.]